MLVHAFDRQTGLTYTRPQAPPHVHRCPGCYEAIPCGMDCTIEPDLTLDNGIPAGSYMTCKRCETAPK